MVDRPRVIGVLALVVASLLASACGAVGASSSAGTSAPSPIGETSTGTAAPVAHLVPAARVIAASARSSRAGSVRMTMTMTPIGGLAGNQVRVVGVLTTRPPLNGSISVTVPTAGGLVTMRETVLPGVVYMHMPAGIRLVGGRWLRVPLSPLAGSGLDALESQDVSPGQELSYLAGTTPRVVDLGPAVVAGLPTTHYRLTVDLRRVAARTDVALRPALEKLVQQEIRLQGSANLPMQAWIDRQGRLRRLTYTLATAEGRMAVTIGLSDFGVPVHVSPPPSADIVTLPPALQAALEKNGL
jgi:hypothetical protein